MVRYEPQPPEHRGSVRYSARFLIRHYSPASLVDAPLDGDHRPFPGPTPVSSNKPRLTSGLEDHSSTQAESLLSPTVGVSGTYSGYHSHAAPTYARRESTPGSQNLP